MTVKEMTLCDEARTKKAIQLPPGFLFRMLLLEPSHHAVRSLRNHMERPWVGIIASTTVEVPKLAVSTIVISEQTFSVLHPPAGQLALSLQAFPVEATIPGGKEIRFPYCALSELLIHIIQGIIKWLS